MHFLGFITCSVPNSRNKENFWYAQKELHDHALRAVPALKILKDRIATARI